MSKKRVTLKKKPDARGEDEEAKVYPFTYKKRGKEYHGWIVRGWKENGKWQRKQYKLKDKALADAYANSINVNLKNAGRRQALVLTSLKEEQIKQAENAFNALGDAYTMDEAVEFFLKHNRPPEFTISITDGLKHYLDEKEREGVREPTRKKTRTIIERFADYAENPLVHTVAESRVIAYLKSLRGQDGVSMAKKKTWNNHRNELASFFKWAGKKDLATNRPWTFQNPLENVPAHSNKRVAEERPDIATTSPETLKELFTYVMNYKEGCLVKWFALAYFAGIRPSTDQGELAKLAEREDDLINLTTGRILLPADMTKTKDSRPIMISDNLKLWLEAYADKPIMPANLKNHYRHVRQKFDLQPDETRHSFISYHIALHRSIGGTAQEAGNSERMIKKHYLDHRPKGEGEAFFSIVPDMDKGQAVFLEIEEEEQEEKFKVV
ncbi:MAG: phage integrase N-terminal SAM-like domain-containing protein [Akkermansiaceae bacterium]|nr:phage integrase N-terminal SAM-like domain-containing protein [Akkermansiaceae bacterium]